MKDGTSLPQKAIIWIKKSCNRAFFGALFLLHVKNQDEYSPNVSFYFKREKGIREGNNL